jgi:predicted HTH transcriptional regulator
MFPPFVIYTLVAVVILIFIRQIYLAIINDVHVRGTRKQKSLFGPLDDLAHETHDDKREIRKRMIVGRAHEVGNITNDAVQAMFHISHTTAWRYLEELEKEDRLVQIGGTGRGVVYQASSGAF